MLTWQKPVLPEAIDPHILNYADRIAKGLRHDGYSNRLSVIDALLIGSRYRVEVERSATTIKDLSIVIASKFVKPQK